jgi:hypothetical protein
LAAGRPDTARALVLQGDGRILAAGASGTQKAAPRMAVARLRADWVVARYTRGGALDRSFGRGGLVVSDLGTGADWAGALAVRPDGKIVVAGSIYESQALARYRAR